MRFVPQVFYRRAGNQTIFARDRLGRSRAFTVHGGVAVMLPGRRNTLGDLRRVDHANRHRFTGAVRSNGVLRAAFIAPANILTTGWFGIPAAANRARRLPNQGMNAPLTALTGGPLSATNYAAWVRGRNPGLGVRARAYEWCHLQAHVFHGAAGPANIVAGVRGNNTEQLSIEKAMHLYRSEMIFQVCIDAVTVNAPDALYLGDAIRYRMRVNGVATEDFLLDCRNPPSVSAHHFYGVLQRCASFANRMLVVRSRALGNSVSVVDRQAVKTCCEAAR